MTPISAHQLPAKLEEGSGDEKESCWLPKILVSRAEAVKHNRTLAEVCSGQPLGTMDSGMSCRRPASQALTPENPGMLVLLLVLASQFDKKRHRSRVLLLIALGLFVGKVIS